MERERSQWHPAERKYMKQERKDSMEVKAKYYVGRDGKYEQMWDQLKRKVTILEMSYSTLLNPNAVVNIWDEARNNGHKEAYEFILMEMAAAEKEKEGKDEV